MRKYLIFFSNIEYINNIENIILRLCPLSWKTKLTSSDLGVVVLYQQSLFWWFDFLEVEGVFFKVKFLQDYTFWQVRVLKKKNIAFWKLYSLVSSFLFCFLCQYFLFWWHFGKCLSELQIFIYSVAYKLG